MRKRHPIDHRLDRFFSRKRVNLQLDIRGISRLINGPRVHEVIYVVYRGRLPIIASAFASRSLLRLHVRDKVKFFA